MSEFTLFELVIHLSKVQQLAIFRVSHVGRMSVEQCAAVPGLLIPQPPVAFA